MATCVSLKPISDVDFLTATVDKKNISNSIPVIRGGLTSMSPKVQRFVVEKAILMRPKDIYIVDGSREQIEEIKKQLIKDKMMFPLKAYENNWIVRTDPKDVARVESKTWIVTPDKYQTVCHTPPGVEPIMGHWMDPEQFKAELDSRFPGCMNGRTMYVIPYSMGPVGGPISKNAVELTDSAYVVLCMIIMTRVSLKVFRAIGNGEYVRCIHSVGVPHPVTRTIVNNWLCNPEKTIIAHRPAEREIWSFGSGYGGNSLLGKKCFALRIASNIARDEGWLAEHMLVMGVTPPGGKEHFIAAAFPSACGKTNLAMLQPTLPGWQVRCVGDDIGWMKFGEDGRLYGINPEAGFFGVCPGTSSKTNPMAMATFQKNSIFTNVAETANGEFFWEGMECDLKDPNVEMINWLGQKWRIGDKGEAAHANSRFTTPASQCPIIHPEWESPKGVPIDAIVFGGRRPTGVPLVIESFSWQHGIFTGAGIKSEATAAAEHKGKKVMHDPMAMRPFMGYNFGKYLQHWVNLEKGHKVPKIYHVNWFRKSADGKYLWPGFGENIRVLDWIIRRCDGDQSIGRETAVGIVPTEGSINLTGFTEIQHRGTYEHPQGILEGVSPRGSQLLRDTGRPGSTCRNSCAARRAREEDQCSLT
uniref:Phosphoenolpyruvate carboxykinase [GTP] n=1 Tax=Ascaris suum TaxID=6253 RepID=F1KSI5_ASCSU